MMPIAAQIEQQKQQNQEIVTTLLTDGSDPDANYTIEHHFSAADFDRLEKAAVEAFKKGFEVNDAEEVTLDDGSTIFCFDAITHHALDIQKLDQSCQELIQLASQLKVSYDGWGTYFIDDETTSNDDDSADSSPWVH